MKTGSKIAEGAETTLTPSLAKSSLSTGKKSSNTNHIEPRNNTKPISTIHSDPLSPDKTFKIGNLVINVFDNTNSLNRSVAQLINQEMQKGGLVVLPADSTHGNEAGKPPGEIFSFLDNLIAKTEINKKLKVTHMDELENGNTKFADNLKKWLPNLIEQLKKRFHAINPKNFEAYKTLMAKGPRVIVGGIGAATPPHIAYIGEEQNPNTGKQVLNPEPRRIKLRAEESERRACTHAFTMGMKSFDPIQNPNLQTVILTAKGSRKIDAVKHALQEAFGATVSRSATGQILKQFINPNPKGPKLILNVDKELFEEVQKQDTSLIISSALMQSQRAV
jgi:hypothetical protein